ncbi:uncharacterized protein LOC132706032 isoform X2 [Cylas formicarius]|uniref:uncharacterized protein LOC132706032 isoform X2 n=1 Tax=Cylas formicarius TaxID=197179 RepID=UPI00295842EA|nr:uncharacterized protein LOC132706032 isoform X2 [Cylas formicarius]
MFTYGLTVPLVLPRRSINFSFCFQSQYNMPFNVSNFYPQTIAVRAHENKFDLTRVKFYEYLASFLESFGLRGEECTLRTVCEVAEIPMYETDETLLEKIASFVFTPSVGLKADIGNKTLEDDGLDFTERLLLAEKYGRDGKNCEKKFSDCIVSILDLFTELYVVR